MAIHNVIIQLFPEYLNLGDACSFFVHLLRYENLEIEYYIFNFRGLTTEQDKTMNNAG